MSKLPMLHLQGFSYWPNIIGSHISAISFNETIKVILSWAISRESRYICVANVHMFIEAHKDPKFASVLEQADMVTPDGMPLVISLRFLYDIHQERIAGMDLMPAIIKEAAKHSIPVFFYGSTKDVLTRIVKRSISEHTTLIIAGTYSPPFRNLTPEEKKFEVQQINNSGAGIVFVALGCPKQEIWMASNKNKINAVMIGIGGAFPVYAGTQHRAPKWMQKYSLEWVYRLIQEPRRLLFRYLNTNSTFIFLLVKQLITKKGF